MQPIPPHNLSSLLEPPFVIRVEHLDFSLSGNFRPAAIVTFAAPLRASGLLHALPPEAAKDLLLLLTFVTPNGLCAPTVHQIAEAMHVSGGKARGRMERLLAFRWQGEPLLLHQKSESGLEAFTPRPWLAPVRENSKPEPPRTSQPPMRAASREEVIAHTRATYARPRAEVEREIEEAMGYRRDEHGRPYRGPAQIAPDSQPQAPPLTSEEIEARRERSEVKGLLLQAGLQDEQAEALLAGYDTVRIGRQLMWLPYRRAKNPAGMLLAAIKDDYEAPPMMRRQVPDQPADGTTTPDEGAPDAEQPSLATKLGQGEEVDLTMPS